MPISDKLDEVQNFIIQTHREQFEESPTPMKLQKLCYYAQGLALGTGNSELFEDDFQAWQHGPVNPALYNTYKNYRWRQIDKEVQSEFNIISEAEKQHIERVVAAFGKFDGAALSTMTHRERPWLEARGAIPETEGSNAQISKEIIKDYFETRLKQIQE